jgi:hypothetical protein
MEGAPAAIREDAHKGDQKVTEKIFKKGGPED